ncbi:MAG: polyphosphate:AMP phosphotransferase [Acidobacteria bacterium]|nr:polyphosphate:AMP phosphotransferase [Acidobacteriota bacterium]
MFESAEVGHSISDREYDLAVPKLREALLNSQFNLLSNKTFPVVIVIGGVDGAGKGETVNILNEWMDPRHIITHAFGEMSDEEQERPRMWRYWRALPPKGHIGILFGAWHTDPIVQCVLGKIGKRQMELAMDQIVAFERMLVDEGALILKFWFHLSRKAQRKRLKALEANPKTRWRVTETDWQRFKLYDKFRKISEMALRQTSTGFAPWIVVEGTEPNYRYLTVGQTLLDAMQQRLSGKRPAVSRAAPLPEPAVDQRTVFSNLDYSQSLTRKNYSSQLEKHQGHLNLLTRDKKFRQRSLIVVFEGLDAGGKGGSIRRITAALDARHYQVIPIAAPTEEERAQPYLWRFWRHLPRQGRVTIFDRSWYGRVLVERVEKFCSEDDWMRAYHEINDFEEQLSDAGAIVIKFWLTITKAEQLKRFRERENTPFKNFKITPEDWRNRKKWDDYQCAACDMIERTSTDAAPWLVIPANDKYFARIQILKTLCDRTEAVL